MSSEAEKQADLERLKLACTTLREHFDTIHIFATRHEGESEDSTFSFQTGGGNWFARFGQVKEWVLKREEQSRCDERRDDRKLDE